MIVLKEVSKSFGSKVLFRNLSLTFPKRGIVAVTGSSGCGKSTLLRLILGLESPDSGSIVTDLRRYSVVFEDDVLLPWLNVLDNVALVTKGERSRARKALDKVGMGSEWASDTADLSGGMKRRVAIARALAYDGECLILDEPTIRLNGELAEEIMDIIKEDWSEKLTIMVTHDLDLAEKYADTCIALSSCAAMFE